MPVLLLASDNKDLENKLAQKLAQKLEYSTLSSQFLNEVAEKYSLDRKKLVDAMTNTPSILKLMSTKNWNYFLSCVEVEVLNRILEDNVVCWGLAAQLYVIIVSHVLKVRLIGGHGGSPLEEDNILSIKDRKAIEERERKRDKWSMAAFGRKESNPELYDLVINMDQIRPEEAVETLATTINYPRFKAMTYSKNTLVDKTLAARVKNTLLKTLTDIHVQANNGTVVVTTTSVKREKSKKINSIKETVGKIKDVSFLEVHWNKDIISEASNSFR